MNHIRLDAERRQNDEGEVVIGRDNHAFTGTAGIFVGDSVQKTLGVYRFIIYRWYPSASTLAGTNRHIEVAFICGGDRFGPQVSQEETDDDALSLILDRRDASRVHLVVCITVCAEHRLTVAVFVIPGRCITDAEARRILDNDPGEQQA